MNDDNSTGNISLWVEESAVIKRGMPGFGKNVSALNKVETKTISSNLKKFLKEIQETLDGQPDSIAGYEIDNVVLNIAVTANGGIELIGKMSAGVTASMSITLQRKKE